jgi:hypothetical protein
MSPPHSPPHDVLSAARYPSRQARRSISKKRNVLSSSNLSNKPNDFPNFSVDFKVPLSPQQMSDKQYNFQQQIRNNKRWKAISPLTPQQFQLDHHASLIKA